MPASKPLSHPALPPLRPLSHPALPPLRPLSHPALSPPQPPSPPTLPPRRPLPTGRQPGHAEFSQAGDQPGKKEGARPAPPATAGPDAKKRVTQAPSSGHSFDILRYQLSDGTFISGPLPRPLRDAQKTTFRKPHCKNLLILFNKTIRETHELYVFVDQAERPFYYKFSPAMGSSASDVILDTCQLLLGDNTLHSPAQEEINSLAYRAVVLISLAKSGARLSPRLMQSVLRYHEDEEGRCVTGPFLITTEHYNHMRDRKDRLKAILANDPLGLVTKANFFGTPTVWGHSPQPIYLFKVEEKKHSGNDPTCIILDTTKPMVLYWLHREEKHRNLTDKIEADFQELGFTFRR